VKTDTRFAVLMITIIIFVLAFSVACVFMLVGDEKQDDNIIFKSHDLEVRAVCTIESGIIVTTNYNSRIAGDAVSSVRMTEAEYIEYCLEGDR